MTNVVRVIPRQVIYEIWGLPWGDDGEIDVEILDDIDNGSGRWESYHTVVFVAPDDGKIYSADYSQGLTEYQDQRPWEDEEWVSITEVEPRQRVITVTDWVPVKVQQKRKISTFAELKAQWKAHVEDNLAAAEDATW